MMMFKSNEEISKKEKVVDTESGWHFLTGNQFLEKAKRLIKNNYVIYDYSINKELSLDELEYKTTLNSRSGSCIIKSYNILKEYVDRKNKVYYIYFGKVNTYDMWC